MKSKIKWLMLLTALLLLFSSVAVNAQSQIVATGMVNTDSLNLRAVPALFNNSPVGRLNKGTVVYITGQSPDLQWYSVTVNQAVSGWVFARYVDIFQFNNTGIGSGGGALPIPIVAPPAIPAPAVQPQVVVQQPTTSTGLIWQVGGRTSFVNVRTGPGLQFGVIGRVSPGYLATATGRSSDNAWVQVIVNDVNNNLVSAWMYAGVFRAYNLSMLPVVA